MTTTKTAPAADERIEINGKPIRFRLPQMGLWTVVLGAFGAALVAGAYFNLLEVNWHIFDLKGWWDGGMGLFRHPSYPLYRHGERDLGEPAVAVLAVKSILASRKSWKHHLHPAAVAGLAVAVLVLAAGLIAGAVWAIDFGMPQAWKHLHGPNLAHDFAWAGHASIETLVAGFAIGFILHKVWAPAGATVQGWYAGRAAAAANRPGKRLPLWVRLPLAPPQFRERVADAPASDQPVKQHGRAVRVLARLGLGVLGLVVLYLIVTGFLAHYYVGTGHHVPFLAP